MKSRMWCVALVGGGLTLLTAAASLHLRGEQRTAALREGLASSPQDGVLWSGPDVDGLNRMEAKDKMVHEVTTGRKSLLAAASLLRRLDDLSPRWNRATELYPDAASEEEAYCRAVIACVGVEITPQWGKEITKSLQAELDARLRDGTLYFDDASPTAAEAYPPETKGTHLISSTSDDSAELDAFSFFSESGFDRAGVR